MKPWFKYGAWAARTSFLAAVVSALGSCASSGNDCQDGDQRPAPDGCNTCTCTNDEWACTLRACVDGGPPSGLKWYPTCGAPVCGPQSNVGTGSPACVAGQSEAAGCASEGALCDPGTGCGVNLVCAKSDPRTGPGGCPISRARFKQDIRYLTTDEVQDLSQQLLGLPLATWRYREGDGREHLGFIIEDVEPSPGIDSRRDQVDLYGYTSMAVAALQEQARALQQLRAEVEHLRTQLSERQRACMP